MPLEFLREIAGGPFPVKVVGEEKIDKLRVLVAAELVIAQMPELSEPGPACVTEIRGFGPASLKVSLRDSSTPNSDS